MNSLLLISFTIIASTITVCDSAKILAVLPVFAKSHHYVMQPFIKELAARGHDITFYTPIPLGKNYSNVKEVEVHVPLEKILLEGLDFQKIRDMGKIPWVNIISFWFMGLGIMDGFLEEPRVQKLIHSNDKYDLVILETHFANEALLALGHKYNAPVVSLATFSSYIFIDEFLGNPYGTAYIPGFELPYTTEMSFFQRVHNTVRVISTMLVGYYFYLPYQESFMRKYFNYTGSETIPPIVDMLQDVSLVITNSHLAVDYPRPWVPNVIGVAGLHINQERTPLPKDLKDFMDNSKNGVIYVSFGSLVPSHQMPSDMKEAFVKTFSKLKQNVLWRFPADSFPDLPKNVKISKWLPQQDVLAHPSMKAFITHGGLLSQEEAVYFGVPLIGVPFFGDQYMNVERSAAHGYGIPLDQYNITETSLTWAINEIINNPSYRENINHRSKIFRDNPQRPIDKAMFWIEYVIRHKGAPHLRSEGRKLPWFKYLLLDVVAVLLLASFLVLYVIYSFIKCLFSLCKGKPKPQVKSTKKKN